MRKLGLGKGRRTGLGVREETDVDRKTWRGKDPRRSWRIGDWNRVGEENRTVTGSLDRLRERPKTEIGCMAMGQKDDQCE